MKASELRIGNLVFAPALKSVRVIDCLDIRDFFEGRLYRSFEGIPLTSEWLWKFGFQPNPREQRLYIQIGEDGWIHYYPGTNEILLATECGYSQFGTRNKIEYVHQLQNLYHSLTAEELTIKDDGKKEGKEEKADREVDRRNMGS